MQLAAIEWQGLSYRYGQEAEIAFDDLKLAAGQHLLLRGASGSGKSTLLALLAGLLSPSAGQIRMAGQSLQDLSPRERDAWRGAELGFVPQRLHLSASLTVADNLDLPYVCAGLPPDRARAALLLDQLGLAAVSQRLPHQLSVGQAQRVALARALVAQPACVLADEPTGNLDRHTAQQMFRLLKQVNAEAKTAFLIVTHDQELAALADRRLHMEAGRLVDAS